MARSQQILSFLLLSIGVMTTLTFGFVPQLNLFSLYLDEIYAGIYWLPFGLSCLIFGIFIDRIKRKRGFSLSFIVWGGLAIALRFSVGNVLAMFILIIAIAVVTGLNMIVAAAFLSIHIPINRRAMISGTYLGLGWALVSLTAYISFLDPLLNLLLLGLMNVVVGCVTSALVWTGRVPRWEDWDTDFTIPKDYNVRKNAAIFWESSLVFGVFLGVIVFLLGTKLSFDESIQSFYLVNVVYYYDVASAYGITLINFDFIIIGAFAAIMSPIFGRLMDKYGRKPIFFLGNVFIPACLISFSFWDVFAAILIAVFAYAIVVTIFVIINCTVWSDLSPEHSMGKYNGYGISSVGLGGTVGYYMGVMITRPEYLEYLDKLIITTIVVLMLVALIPFVSMRDSLPPAEEMEWPTQILQMYIIIEGGIEIAEYSFEAGERVDAQLFSGGVTGITAMLQEMIKSQNRVKVIDHEDKKLLFEYGKKFQVALVALKDLRILRTKLRTLTQEIESVFWETIANWDGNLDVFKPIRTMIRNYFVVE